MAAPHISSAEDDGRDIEEPAHKAPDPEQAAIDDAGHQASSLNSPDPLAPLATRPLLAAVETAVVVAASKPKNNISNPKTKLAATPATANPKRHVIKAKKQDGRPPISPDSAGGSARPGRNLVQSLVKDIMVQYELERKKVIEYMAGITSRVAITSDLWTSDNQKRGYMAITAHFIDESWTLRSIIMRFIYVPAPHTTEVIGDELYDSLVDWNLDEKISPVTLDNCTTNDALAPFALFYPSCCFC
ncbi:hypothetical protein E2562_003445 [Oryza meyeriana var. granulata]|uniref:hAT-like transposase RNase-H fold domain-containing protein n=1 Tax=Oryza meyeriana var. granulata TaxID=110450 RepID=A0A6G1EF71_9ORYZ|nr:hypothetical protein E2562_003445 [Oryza meyeriana var. granulata]